jgi:hypothetical protein
MFKPMKQDIPSNFPPVPRHRFPRPRDGVYQTPRPGSSRYANEPQILKICHSRTSGLQTSPHPRIFNSYPRHTTTQYCIHQLPDFLPAYKPVPVPDLQSLPLPPHDDNVVPINSQTPAFIKLHKRMRFSRMPAGRSYSIRNRGGFGNSPTDG